MQRGVCERERERDALFVITFWNSLSGANVNCQAHDQATPLFIAAQEGKETCVELLLSSGADPNQYCNEEEWQLPIHAAAQMGHNR